MGQQPLQTADTLRLVHELREKYRDGPVSIKMCRETWRLLIVEHNIKESAEPMNLLGMPIIFDEEIPVGEFRDAPRG